MGRGGQRNKTERARTNPLGYRADGSTFAGGVAAFKDDNNPLSRLLDPVLHRAQLCLQLPQDLLVLLALELRPFVDIPGGIKRLVMCINILLCHLRTTPRGPRSAAYLWRPPEERATLQSIHRLLRQEKRVAR